MNANFKTRTEAVPKSLGRPMRILPLGPRSAATQRRWKTNSVEGRILKRTTSAGSVTPLSSAYTRSKPLSALHTKLDHLSPHNTRLEVKHENCRRPELLNNGAISQVEDHLGNKRTQNGSKEPKQDGLCDVLSPGSAGSCRSNGSKQRKKSLTTDQILKLCLESDPSKVFEVDLHGKELNSTPQLEMFIRLRVLDLSGNYIKVISGLDSNKELRELKMYDNQLSSIEGLENLKELCSLQLQHNHISALGRGLGTLKKLHSLRLDNNLISRIEIPELLSCSNITSLDLSHNRLQTLAALSYLPNLEELFAAGNRIKNTGNLTKCKKLQEVDLSRNEITDLSGLANLPNLQILDVSNNQLKTLKSVCKLKSLEELNINNNQVDELSSFASLFPNLQILFACNNKIYQWDEICSLSGCVDLVELYVEHNDFTLEDGEMPDYQHAIAQAVPHLEVIDGITLKKLNSKKDSNHPMRPMSATSGITMRQVDSQLLAASQEEDSILKSITERFTAVRTLVHSLPSEPPNPRATASSVVPPNSRCSSRSRLRDAQNFAAMKFNDEEKADGGSL